MPAVLAVLFLLTLLASLGAVRESLASHADWASAPVLAELFPEIPPGADLTLGDYPWYEALWLLIGTGWLPAHHTVWEFVPFVLWLATAGAVGLGTRRFASSTWAGVVAASLVVCGGIAMRGALWSLNTHGPAAFHVALVAAVLAAVVARPTLRRGPKAYALAVIVGAITAVGATDPLVAPLALGPLLAAGVVLWLRRGQAAVLRLGLVVSLVSIAGARWLDTLGERANITWTHKAVQFVDADAVVDQLGRLPSVVARLAGNSGFGLKAETTPIIAMAGGLLALLALAVVLHTGVRMVKDLLADATDITVPNLTTDLWLAGLVFWISVLVVDLLAFTFTNAAFDAQAARYLVPGWIAVCVLIPALALRAGVPWLGALVASLIAASSLYGFAHAPRPTSESPGFVNRSTAEQVSAFGRAHGATKGFASFWDAIPITWHTRFATELYPLWVCPDDAEMNCRFYEHGLSSWYDARPGPTLLVIDSALPIQPLLDPDFGQPVATATFGTLTAYVFDHDLTPQIR